MQIIREHQSNVNDNAMYVKFLTDENRNDKLRDIIRGFNDINQYS